MGPWKAYPDWVLSTSTDPRRFRQIEKHVRRRVKSIDLCVQSVLTWEFHTYNKFYQHEDRPVLRWPAPIACGVERIARPVRLQLFIRIRCLRMMMSSTHIDTPAERRNTRSFHRILVDCEYLLILENFDVGIRKFRKLFQWTLVLLQFMRLFCLHLHLLAAVTSSKPMK